MDIKKWHVKIGTCHFDPKCPFRHGQYADFTWFHHFTNDQSVSKATWWCTKPYSHLSPSDHVVRWFTYISISTQKIVSFHSIAKGCRIGLPCVSIEFVHPFLPDQLNPTCAIPTAIIYGCIAPKKAVKHTCTKRCLSVHHFPGQLPSLSSILVLVSKFLLLDDESPTCTWWHPSDILPDIYSEFYLPYIRAFLSHDLAVYLTFYVTLWHFIWHIFWHGFLAFYPLVN